MNILPAFTSNILSWVLIGIVIAIIVKVLDKTEVKGGFSLTLLIALFASLAGGALAQWFTNGRDGIFNPVSFIIALSSAVIAVLIQRIFLTKNDQEDLYYDTEQASVVSGNPDLVYYSQVTPLRNDQDSIHQLLDEAHYPISKRDLVRFAENENVSTNLLSRLESLEDHIYDSPSQIINALDSSKHSV